MVPPANFMIQAGNEQPAVLFLRRVTMGLIWSADGIKVAGGRRTEGHCRNRLDCGSEQPTFVTEPGRSGVDSAGVALLKFINFHIPLAAPTPDLEQRHKGDFSQEGV